MQILRLLQPQSFAEIWRQKLFLKMWIFVMFFTYLLNIKYVLVWKCESAMWILRCYVKRVSQESAEALNASRQVTLAQKQDLLDLYMDKKRPLWTGQMHQLFLVTTTFLDSWRSWIRCVRVPFLIITYYLLFNRWQACNNKHECKLTIVCVCYRDSKPSAAVTSLDNQTLLCAHNRLLYDPATIPDGPSTGLLYKPRFARHSSVCNFKIT